MKMRKKGNKRKCIKLKTSEAAARNGSEAINAVVQTATASPLIDTAVIKPGGRNFWMIIDEDGIKSHGLLPKMECPVSENKKDKA